MAQEPSKRLYPYVIRLHSDHGEEIQRGLRHDRANQCRKLEPAVEAIDVPNDDDERGQLYTRDPRDRERRRPAMRGVSPHTNCSTNVTWSHLEMDILHHSTTREFVGWQ